jgi:hypothetical protein
VAVSRVQHVCPMYKDQHLGSIGLGSGCLFSAFAELGSNYKKYKYVLSERWHPDSLGATKELWLRQVRTDAPFWRVRYLEVSETEEGYRRNRCTRL